MLSIEKLLEERVKSDMVVKKVGQGLLFDHYGIKVPDSDTYNEVCEFYGEKTNEVILSERRVATVVGEAGVFEILEPKKDEEVNEVYLDHLSYRTANFEELKNSFDNLVAEFNFGKTKGIKVEVGGRLIEFRNDKLTESKID